MKKIIKSVGILPYSDAVFFKNEYVMEISGKIGTDPNTGKLARGITNQTHIAIGNISTILEKAGWGLENIVKVRIYLTDMKNYAKMNEAYGKYFRANFPARVALAVKGLPLNALIEIECVACGNKMRFLHKN